MRATVLLLSSLALLVAPVSTASERSNRGPSKTKPAVRLSKATGRISRLDRSKIAVAGLSCKRARTSPSLHGLGLGAKVAISCRDGALTTIAAVRPAKVTPPAPAASSSTATTSPVPTPPVTTPAPGTCTKDSSYQPPGPLPFSPSQVGVILAIDQPHLYAVSGNTAAEISAQIRQCRPTAASPYSAVTQYSLNYRYTATKGPSGLCKLTAIAVSLHAGLVLPDWIPGANPAPGLAEQWQSYIAALTFHEQGHVDRYVEAAQQLLADLEALPELDCAGASAQVYSSFLRVAVDVTKAQNAYDAETAHGRTQGATLVAQ